MTERLLKVRRGVPAVLLGAILLVLVFWLVVEIRDVHDRLRQAQQDSRTLAQQVRDLGGVPQVTPQPGPTGAAGSPGAPGQPGSSGSSGSNGRPGQNGASGKPGSAGASGAPGASGAAGVKGDTGPPGDKGDTGETGPKGDQGDAGSPGPTCPDGYHTTTTTVVTSTGPQDAVICTAN